MGTHASGPPRTDLIRKARRAMPALRARLQGADGVLSTDGIDVTIRSLAVAVTIVLNLAGFGQPGEVASNSAWVSVALIVYNSLIITVLGVPFRHPPGFALFVVDWVVASAAIIIAGGFFSPFIVLYYALAIGAALRLGFSRSLLLVGGCAAVFSALTATNSLLPGAVKLPIMVVEITSLLMVVVTTVGMSHTVEVEAERLGREEKAATQLRRLNDYTQAVLAASPDLAVALQAVARAARVELGADRALAVLINQESSTTTRSGPVMASDAYPVPPQLGQQEAGLLEEAKCIRSTLSNEAHTTTACAPLAIGTEVLGAVFVYFDGPSRTGDIDLSRLEDVGKQMALAIRLTRLYELERERAARSEESERVERDLLSVVSHELRTPLTSIKTAVGSLKTARQRPENNAEKAQLEGRLILNMERSTERLIMLVDELLDMARLRANRVTLNLRPLNLPDLITEVASQAQLILEERGQTIEMDFPPRGSQRWEQMWVLADRRRLEQVLLNLLSNAAKYGPHGSKVTVGTTAREGTVRVFVRDEGPGVPREEQSAIFEKFYQANTNTDERDSRSRGLGLGLAIARAIVEMHGGTIGVTTSASRGSTFHFSLPLCDCPGRGGSETDELPAACIESRKL